jgi:2-iminobutanoate/2-iminopropanoate deaminase
VTSLTGVDASGGESDRAAYSAAIRVGDLVFVSGQVSMGDDGEPVAPGDFRAQAEVAFGRLRDVLLDAGSNLEHVAKVTIYLTDRANVAHLVDLRRRWFREPFPADTTVVVASLARAEWMIEIDAVAVVPSA